jgi:mannose-6-phosphate isomerase
MLANVTPIVDPAALLRPLRPIPLRSVRPWAGGRLGAPGEDIGELWLAGPGSIVDLAGAGGAGVGEAGGAVAGEAGGAVAGRMTLDALAAAVGPALVGERGMRLLGARFPLLVKVIDAAEWLSLQVHPDDALAAELYGEGQLGKAEAWLVLDAEPGATLVTGPRRDLPEAALRAAIRDGVVGREHCDERPCLPGDALMLRAGTMHAIGPGTFVYEIEQPSDRTFRMSDWGRPATTERPLHVQESLRAIRPERHALVVGQDWRLDGGALTVPEFRLEIAEIRAGNALARTPAGETLEIVTAIRGRLTLTGDGWQETLEPYETLVVPAAVSRYRIEGLDGSLSALGSVP